MTISRLRVTSCNVCYMASTPDWLRLIAVIAVTQHRVQRLILHSGNPEVTQHFTGRSGYWIQTITAS